MCDTRKWGFHQKLCTPGQTVYRYKYKYLENHIVAYSVYTAQVIFHNSEKRKVFFLHFTLHTLVLKNSILGVEFEAKSFL